MAPEQRRGASVPRNSSYPASVQPGIPKLVPLPSGWSRARYGDLLYEVQRPVKLNDNQEYQLVTAKRSRGGIIARQRLRGEQIKTPTQFFIRTGDFFSCLTKSGRLLPLQVVCLSSLRIFAVGSRFDPLKSKLGKIRDVAIQVVG
jgi:hypothetical protein